MTHFEFLERYLRDWEQSDSVDDHVAGGGSRGTHEKISLVDFLPIGVAFIGVLSGDGWESELRIILIKSTPVACWG